MDDDRQTDEDGQAADDVICIHRSFGSCSVGFGGGVGYDIPGVLGPVPRDGASPPWCWNATVRQRQGEDALTTSRRPPFIAWRGGTPETFPTGSFGACPRMREFWGLSPVDGASPSWYWNATVRQRQGEDTLTTSRRPPFVAWRGARQKRFRRDPASGCGGCCFFAGAARTPPLRLGRFLRSDAALGVAVRGG